MKIIIACLALTAASSFAQELTLDKLYEKSDLVCVGKVLSRKLSGKVRKMQFNKTMHLPPKYIFVDRKLRVEEYAVKMKCECVLKGKNKTKTVNITTYYKPRDVTSFPPELRDYIDWLDEGETYLFYLKKVGTGYQPTTITRYAFILSAPVKPDRTPAQIFKDELRAGQRWDILDRTWWLIHEIENSEAKLKTLAMKYKDSKDPYLRGCAYCRLMSADKPKLLKEAYRFILDQKKIVARQPEWTVDSPENYYDRETMVSSLTSQLAFAFIQAPSWEAESFEVIEDILRTAKPKSDLFYSALEALTECSSSRGSWKGERNERREARSAAAQICKPAVIECLRKRRRNMPIRLQSQILTILSKMDDMNYGLEEEFLNDRKVADAEIQKVLKKYPPGWERVQ